MQTFFLYSQKFFTSENQTYYLPSCFAKCSLIFKKVISLMSCSTLQLSSYAVASSTPSTISAFAINTVSFINALGDFKTLFRKFNRAVGAHCDVSLFAEMFHSNRHARLCKIQLVRNVYASHTPFLSLIIKIDSR